MPIEYFNPTPIYYADFSTLEFESIGEEIEQNIKNDMYGEEEWDNYVQTTRKTNTNIFNSVKLPNLETAINKHIRIFLKESGEIKKNFCITDSWFCKLPKFGCQERHTHEPYDINYFAGAYFYENKNTEMSPLEFFPNNGINEQIVKHKYTPGRIIIFSGLLPHRVRYNKSDEIRSSFSFNFKLI